jgi:hypothetical protein
MITVTPDDNMASQMQFVPDYNISSQMITLAPDDYISYQMIKFDPR